MDNPTRVVPIGLALDPIGRSRTGEIVDPLVAANDSREDAFDIKGRYRIPSEAPLRFCEHAD